MPGLETRVIEDKRAPFSEQDFVNFIVRFHNLGKHRFPERLQEREGHAADCRGVQ